MRKEEKVLMRTILGNSCRDFLPESQEHEKVHDNYGNNRKSKAGKEETDVKQAKVVLLQIKSTDGSFCKSVHTVIAMNIECKVKQSQSFKKIVHILQPAYHYLPTKEHYESSKLEHLTQG